MRSKQEYFSEDLCCYVKLICYNYEERIGTLYMGDGSCCDMSACIKLCTGIDPNVTVIRTYSGGKRDTVYSRSTDSDTKWQAYQNG